MLSKYFVDIDSFNRLSGTDSNFTYAINFPQDGVKYDRVTVSSVTIPKSFYLIQSNYNTFVLSEGLSSATVTIPVGNYVLGAFKTAVQTALNTYSPHSWTYTVTFPNTYTSANTGKFTYTVTGNSGTQPSFTFSNFVYDQMGFPKNSTTSFSGSTLTSTNVINLQADSSLYVKSNMVDGTNTTLQRIDGGLVPDFGVISYQCPYPLAFAHRLSSVHNNTYSITILNSDGIPVDFNGQNCIISLIFFHLDDTNIRAQNYMKYMISKVQQQELRVQQEEQQQSQSLPDSNQ
jgi:hypothetical protein